MHKSTTIITRSENKIIEKVILSKISISPKVVYMMYAMNRMYIKHFDSFFFSHAYPYKTRQSDLQTRYYLTIQ